MVAPGAGGLEAREALADVDAVDEPQLLELLDDPVDTRARDAALAALAQRLLDLDGRQRAALAIEQLEHRGAGAAAAVARRGERGGRVLGPARVPGGAHRTSKAS